jgi:TRAP-type mannitol/chloroaromatic compound transport system substrate-binding protein
MTEGRQGCRSDPLTRQVYESFLSFRRTAIRWGELSERAYLNARSLPFPYADFG